jgi:hypothetical protein
MTRKLPTPPVPDLARAKGGTVPELVDWFVDYYNQGGAPFNYRRGTKSVRSAYKGLHKIHLLTAGCASEPTAIGRTANADIVRAAAPFAFGRDTQVFDLSPRKFAFGKDRFAGYRIPFLFVENGIVYVYYLQPRKNAGPDFDELGMVATIVKTYLLDVEFYGLKSDVEFVDAGTLPGEKIRFPRKYSLSDLKLWSDKRLSNRLTMISEALDIVSGSERVVRRPRAVSRPEPDMPLFD